MQAGREHKPYLSLTYYLDISICNVSLCLNGTQFITTSEELLQSDLYLSIANVTQT